MLQENRQDSQGENMVKLYSTHCPQCIMLENLLKQKKVNFELVKTTPEDVKAMGFNSVPILEVDGKFFTFIDARTWVNKQ